MLDKLVFLMEEEKDGVRHAKSVRTLFVDLLYFWFLTQEIIHSQALTEKKTRFKQQFL